MPVRPKFRTSIALSAVLVVMSNAPISAQTSDVFPVRRVSFYIGFAAGGYDAYARMVARHMGRHLPGEPDVVPMNMPGAGSVKLVQFLASSAPTDGSAIGIIDRGLFVAIYTNPAIPKFNFQAMNWIGSITNENLLCVSWHASPIKTFEDTRKHEFVTGGISQGVAWTSAQVMQKILGAKMKYITGYPGGNDVSIAMERGELDGRCAWSHSSINRDWLEGKKINVLVQFVPERSAKLPDVPTAVELVANEKQRAVVRFLYAAEAVARPIVAPPGVPKGRVEILRHGFLNTMSDRAFLAEADKLGLDVNPASGAELAEIIERISKTPPEIVEDAKTLLK